MLGTATHALGIIHSHSESARLRTTERGSTTGSFRQPVAEIGQMRGNDEGVVPPAPPRRAPVKETRGLPTAGDWWPPRPRYGAYTARACAPRLLSVVLRQSDSHHISLTSLIISLVPSDRSSASCPIRRATVSPCSEKKNGSGGQRRATVPFALHRPTRPPARTGQLQSPKLR